MAKLKDIELSLRGESEVQDNAEHHSAIATQNAKMPEVGYVIFKLKDTKKKGGTYIPNIDDVINPETGKVERIRLLAGVESIWQKDQKDLTPDYIRQNSRSLCFPRGAKCLRIPNWDKAALDFARLCNHNIGNEKRTSGSKFEFFEYDPAKQAQEALNREVLELEMAMVAKELSDESVKKYCVFLKISLNDEIGELKQPELLKKELMLYAKRNPYLFQNLVNERSKEVETSYLVKKLVLSAKIDVASQVGKAFWSNGGGLIGAIPNGKEPVQYLTELAMTNTEQGRNFAEALVQNNVKK